MASVNSVAAQEAKIRRAFTYLYALETTWEKEEERHRAITECLAGYTGWSIHLGDLHIPYTRWDCVRDALRFVTRNCPRPRILIVGGDNMDLAYFSRFVERKDIREVVPEYDDTIPFNLSQLKRFLDLTAELFDHVYVLAGNHDERLFKFLLRHLPPEAANLMIDSLDAYITGILRADNITFCPRPYIRVGEIISCHPESSSVIPGRVVQNLIKRFLPRIYDFRAVVAFHTHSVSKIEYLGKIGVEAGATCKVPDYSRRLRGAVSRERRLIQGFAYAYTRKGRLPSMNDINYRVLDEERWE